MSADVKIWTDNDDGYSWQGLHSGHCLGEINHEEPWTLSHQIREIEKCVGRECRWHFRTYPDGQIGLIGYV